jgi:hypothetical protein
MKKHDRGPLPHNRSRGIHQWNQIRDNLRREGIVLKMKNRGQCTSNDTEGHAVTLVQFTVPNDDITYQIDTIGLHVIQKHILKPHSFR